MSGSFLLSNPYQPAGFVPASHRRDAAILLSAVNGYGISGGPRQAHRRGRNT
jgi:hypothetical protein